MRYGSLRSFKIIEIVTNRKAICDFLLLFYYNFIFYRFRDVTTFWSKIFLPFLPTPVSFEAHARGLPETPRVRKLVSKN